MADKETKDAIDEINAAIDIDADAAETARKEAEVADAVEDEDDDSKKDGASDDGGTDNGDSTKDEDDKGIDTDTDDDAKDVITDDHLERAVKAGFTMAEARKFKSAELLESMVSRLEDKAQKDKADDDKGGSDGKDPLADIPDLDPEEFDERLVATFGALKGIIRSQQDEINGLRQTGRSTADSWFDDQAKGLDKPVADSVKANPEKLKAIRGKFDVLTAGYKAAGQDVSRGDVFTEAVGITMGDVIAQVAIDKKTAELAARAKKHTNRPAGNKGDGKGDALAEIADDIDRKHFNKK